ncbi:MAG TPA: hypothetical protein VK698_06055 [Kofleriaceae bacterium]|nr:hypothetical protein [Kofleriaceae bacterium]
MTKQPPDQDSRPRDTAAAEKPEGGAPTAADRHHPGGGTVPTPPPTPGDLAALLLELLRKINSEVPTTPPLQGRAEDAVTNFASISKDLRTLADGSFTAVGSSNRSKRA